MRRRTTPTLSASLHFIALTKPPPTGSVPLCESKVTVGGDRKSTRLNSSHSQISYAVFCLKKKTRHPNFSPAWGTTSSQAPPIVKEPPDCFSTPTIYSTRSVPRCTVSYSLLSNHMLAVFQG